MSRRHIQALARYNQQRGPKATPKIYRFPASDETKLQLIPHVELDKLLKRDGNENSWHTITARVNLGCTLAYWYYCNEDQTVADRALEALRSVRKRGDDTGVWGLSGDEYRLIGAGLNATDELQKQTPRVKLAEALEHVYRVASEPNREVGARRVSL
ncbi:hypothetical protein [Cupriavidus sp. UYPR2.512]|uniref:hypothetical protein n=1 Tax=Cupriavidus sp. UYPR2.512 TaxID=1080187 RepID=UPI00037B56AF|nr:hypothetical protein [Cupriavidus sp. UYPR2.512]UIF90921.1 hypothetical protein KAF44_32565 [Cupriavidus necator]